MKTIIVIAIALQVITVNAQTVLYPRITHGIYDVQILANCIQTNKTIIQTDGRRVATKPYFIMKAVCYLIDEKNTTNTIWEKEYVDDNQAPVYYFAGEKGVDIVPLKIYDVYLNIKQKQIAILYCQRTKHLFCPIIKYPPFPGKQLFHEMKNRGDDLCLCCRIQDENFVAPGPLIDSARIENRQQVNELVVIIKMNKHASNKSVIFKRTAEKWMRRE